MHSGQAAAASRTRAGESRRNSIATEIAGCSGAGRPRPLPQLTPRLYADLRRMAHSVMRAERAGHTLQPTAVLNEAFSRLLRSRLITSDAPHFFRLAAQSMRHVLIDHARQRNRGKRETPTADELRAITEPGWSGAGSTLPLDVLDIDRALNALAEKSPRAAHLLELRYFAGLEDAEIAALCGISKTTVERECRLGKAFLNRFTQQDRSQR